MNELVTRQQETGLSISTETKELISITLLLGGHMHNKAVLITRSICWIMIICTIVGCGPSTVEVMNSWKGSHVSELIQSWGPPQSVTSDGKDGRIYIWSKHFNIALGGQTRSRLIPDGFGGYYINSQSTPQFMTQREWSRMFWVNRNGVIYYWRAHGFIDEKVEPKKVALAAVIGAGIAGVVILLAIIVEEMQN